jgi:chromosome segregation ATPase
MADGTRSQSSVPSPAPKPSMGHHRISDSLDPSPFAARKPGPYKPDAPSNNRQYHQLERDITTNSNPSTPSMADINPISFQNVAGMNERNPESATTQHLPYETGDLNQNVMALGSEGDQLRNECDAALTRVDRLAEDLAQADKEIHRLHMKLSDLDTENDTLEWTVRSLQKELQLAQARVIDAQRYLPVQNPYSRHEDRPVEPAEAHARYDREHRYLEQLEEEREILLDDNHDLQRMIEGYKDAEEDLKRELKSYRIDNAALRERLAAANKSAGSEPTLERELESKRNQVAHLTGGKKEAERALEQLKRAANIGPELISAFSKLETMADQMGDSVSRRRTPKDSSRTSSSGQLAQGSGEHSVPVPKRQRYK